LCLSLTFRRVSPTSSDGFSTTTLETREGLHIHSVIPGRLEEANPESRDSGSGADAPSRNDKVLPRKQGRRHEMLTPFV
jgi:hypothetical protein